MGACKYKSNLVGVSQQHLHVILVGPWIFAHQCCSARVYGFDDAAAIFQDGEINPVAYGDEIRMLLQSFQFSTDAAHDRLRHGMNGIKTRLQPSDPA